MAEPSTQFSEAFGGGVGSPSLHCNCGRRHYAPDSEFVGENEEQEMRDDYAENPDKVVIHDRDDGVSGVHINGVVIVRGCPCGWLAKFEDYVWNERERILQYYKLRREADAKALAGLSTALGEGRDQ
jgi:hypothetical protein